MLVCTQRGLLTSKPQNMQSADSRLRLIALHIMVILIVICCSEPDAWDASETPTILDPYAWSVSYNIGTL